MPRRHVATITDVAEGHLCTGCGVCAAVQPDDLVMVDDLHHGRRPMAKPGRASADTSLAMAACPGHALGHGERPANADPELWEAWGPVLEVWEGYAGDAAVRYAGSSGGAATALATHGLEHDGMAGVLHIRARSDARYLNETVLSTTAEELFAATGSRYAPASPGDGLGKVRDADGPCVMIGKPCDVAGAAKAAALDPELADRLGLTIAIFCAGTPNTHATLEMVRTLGVEPPETVVSVRYRGNGWPGNAVARDDDGNGGETSYAQSWGEMLQQHRQWRCYVCIDHTGEFADISVGDPWYRTIEPDDPGRSLIIARTERGRAFLHAAVESGALTAERVDHALLPASQPNLLETRGAVWGRVQALRLAGVAAPTYTNMDTFGLWRSELSWKERFRSIAGTFTRVKRKSLRSRAVVTPYQPPAELLPASTGNPPSLRDGEEAR